MRELKLLSHPESIHYYLDIEKNKFNLFDTPFFVGYEYLFNMVGRKKMKLITKIFKTKKFIYAFSNIFKLKIGTLTDDSPFPVWFDKENMTFGIIDDLAYEPPSFLKSIIEEIESDFKVYLSQPTTIANRIYEIKFSSSFLFFKSRNKIKSFTPPLEPFFFKKVTDSIEVPILNTFERPLIYILFAFYDNKFLIRKDEKVTTIIFSNLQDILICDGYIQYKKCCCPFILVSTSEFFEKIRDRVDILPFKTLKVKSSIVKKIFEIFFNCSIDIREPEVVLSHAMICPKIIRMINEVDESECSGIKLSDLKYMEYLFKLFSDMNIYLGYCFTEKEMKEIYEKYIDSIMTLLVIR